MERRTFSKDESPRKKRVQQPRSKPGVAELLSWSNKSLAQISDIVNASYLSANNKSNLRQLTKNEVRNLEQLKVEVFTNIKPLSDITNNDVLKAISSKSRIPQDFSKVMIEQNINLNDMTLEQFRTNVIGLFIEQIV